MEFKLMQIIKDEITKLCIKGDSQLVIPLIGSLSRVLSLKWFDIRNLFIPNNGPNFMNCYNLDLPHKVQGKSTHRLTRK